MQDKPEKRKIQYLYSRNHEVITGKRNEPVHVAEVKAHLRDHTTRISQWSQWGLFVVGTVIITLSIAMIIMITGDLVAKPDFLDRLSLATLLFFLVFSLLILFGATVMPFILRWDKNVDAPYQDFLSNHEFREARVLSVADDGTITFYYSDAVQGEQTGTFKSHAAHQLSEDDRIMLMSSHLGQVVL
jgi:hypothetical protein